MSEIAQTECQEGEITHTEQFLNTIEQNNDWLEQQVNRLRGINNRYENPSPEGVGEKDQEKVAALKPGYCQRMEEQSERYRRLLSTLETEVEKINSHA